MNIIRYRLEVINDSVNFCKLDLERDAMHFDILIMGKPRFDIYVDDKNLGFKSNWASYINQKYLNGLKRDKR